ncbi:putative zinc transport system ATP-binding protein AdcC [Candidatus Rubidus massiliensis]|nr:putative zinc transport system ATP-binding protein AdcC [Candidatus Rubidus massiliensis]
MSALQVSQLSVNYEKTPVLWDINFAIPQGKLVGIIGPNGAGKSTLMKAVIGLVTPISGKVDFFTKSLKQMRNSIAYVPQRESVDWDFPVTILDLVVMGSYGSLPLFKRPGKEEYLKAENYLKMVGLFELKDRQISQLSGGQQQRAFIARALMQDAQIYFLDEPFAGIDHSSEKIIIDILKKLTKENKTIFVVHHDLNTVESYYEWVILLNMRLIGCGETKEVFTNKNLQSAYGKNFSLFDDAVKLSKKISTGLD